MGLLGKILGIKKPKASDYKPTEAEKTQAAVASAEWQRWTTNYGGILPEISRQLQQENVRSNLRSRAGADVMQTVGPISLARTKDLGFTSDVEQARLQSLSQADTQASDFQIMYLDISWLSFKSFKSNSPLIFAMANCIIFITINIGTIK